MAQTKLDILTQQTADFCSSHDPESGTLDLPHDLLTEILKAAYEEPDFSVEYLSLVDQLQTASCYDNIFMGIALGAIGYSLYDTRKPELAEFIFRRAVSTHPSLSARNNLAYVCRHHKDVLHASNLEIIDLLIKGVEKREPFSLVNMALHFACNLSREDDWLLADRMIRLIPEAHHEFDSVICWWRDLADENDDEGLLALQWLARHRKYVLPESYQTQMALLRKRRSDIPGWIFEICVRD